MALVPSIEFLRPLRDYVASQAPGVCWYIGGAMAAQAERMDLTDADILPLRSALNRICRRHRFGPTLCSDYSHLEQGHVLQVLDTAIAELLAEEN